MRTVYSGADVYIRGQFEPLDIVTENGTVVDISPRHSHSHQGAYFTLSKKIIVPGFADVHVHLREPGFSYKETVGSGTRAAAAGGYTAVCAMPNLNPPPDSAEHLQAELDIIARDSIVPVLPYGAITVGQRGAGELVDFAGLAPLVFGFSDDGKGVQDEGLMREAMVRIRASGSFLAAHCEDESLLDNGYIHKGRYAKAHGHRGICSRSEWGQIERDLRLVEETGCRYHVCHISTAESVSLIRAAKARGLPVTCETAPHYLLLCEDDLREDGRFKMNPPLRGREDRDALLEGLRDGTIDVIATDHAPHSAAEKAKGLRESAMGIVGLETAFSTLYTGLVKRGVITLERLVELMSINPRKHFKLPPGEIERGAPANFAVIDLEKKWVVDPGAFQSMGRATPFEGWEVSGMVLMTVINGRIVWERT